ncbi:MAG: TolC family protein, partial [Flavobacteriaceae bacterium]|nr:TolC family protein [Flavobacteriaceae bacterium]
NEANQKKNLEVSKQRYERANYGFEYGQNTRLDVLNAEVDMNNDSIAYLNAKLLLNNGKRDLNVVLGRPINTNFEVTTEVEYILGLNLASLMKSAEENNVTVLQARKNIELGEYTIRMNRAGYMPNVALTSSYAWTKSNNEPTSPFSPLLSVQKGINAGVSLSWDIFDGGQTKTRVDNARITLKNQEIRTEETVEVLKRDLNNAWETYQNSLYTLEVQRTNVATNQLNFERSTEQYKLGRITSIDFRQAQINLNNAELNLSQAKYAAKNAELNLLQLAGILLENTNY